MKPFVKLKIKVNPRLFDSLNKFISGINMEGQIDIEYDINLPMDKYSIERVE
ncbi:hypothetical protein [Persephonella sp.]